MKKFIKTLAIMASLAMVLGFASCSNSDDDSGSGSNTTTQKKSDLELAQAALSIDDEVAGDTIPLPSGVAGYNDVTITWASSNTAIINISAEDGSVTVTQQEGTGVDEVTLTATLKEGTNTRTKTFTVKVYQASADLSNEKIFELASAQVKALLVAPAKAYKEVFFERTITVQGKNVDVELEVVKLNVETADEAADESVQITDFGNNDFGISEYGIQLYRTLFDHTAKVNAKYTLGSASKEEEISVLLPALTKFVYSSTYTNSYSNSSGTEGGEITYTNTTTILFDTSKGSFEYLDENKQDYTSGPLAGRSRTSKRGSKGTFAADNAKEIFTLTTTKALNSTLTGNENYYGKQELCNMMYSKEKAYLDAFKAFEASQTMATAFELFKQQAALYGEEATSADFESYVLSQLETPNTYANLTDAEKDTFLAKMIVENNREKYSTLRLQFDFEDLVTLPWRALAPALKAYDENKTVANAVNLLVAFDLSNGQAKTKKDIEASICSNYGLDSISDFDIDDAVHASKKTSFLTGENSQANYMAKAAKSYLINMLNLTDSPTVAEIYTAYETAYAEQWTSIYAQFKTNIEEELDEEFLSNAPASCEIQYTLGSILPTGYDVPYGAMLELYAGYDSSKPWYEQNGSYLDESGNNSVRVGSIGYNGTYYYNGSWNSNYTEFTNVSGSGEDTVTTVINVTDNNDGTLSISIGTDTPVTVEFNGYGLFSSGKKKVGI